VQSTLLDCEGAIDALCHRRDALEREILSLLPTSPWAIEVGRLRCLRGIDTLTAVGLCAEIGDFERFAKAEQLHGVRNTVHSPHMAKIVPVREFRTKLSELLSDVADRRDHVLVTRNGKPAAALVPIDEYEALEETAEILSDPATLAAIEAGLADLARGDTVTLDDLRGELRDRRAAR
jgi:prevent-host-death family protein